MKVHKTMSLDRKIVEAVDAKTTNFSATVEVALKRWLKKKNKK